MQDMCNPGGGFILGSGFLNLSIIFNPRGGPSSMSYGIEMGTIKLVDMAA